MRNPVLGGVLALAGLVLGAGATPSARGQTYSVLYNFCSLTNCSDGGDPLGGVIQDAKGNLYGTTYQDGAYSLGTVFKVDTSGTETVLHSFTGGADGALPYAGMIEDPKGNLYGTTYLGGDLNCNSGYGCGTVFKLNKTGQLTVLYSFTGGVDGMDTYAGVIQDAKGNLYGTTLQAGAYSYGTVFKLSKAGQLTVLYSFTGGKDGANPYAGVIQDAKGNLYGTTYQRGAHNYGTVFKLSKTGKVTVLHGFTGGTDGGYPYAGVIQDTKGNLYGTTSYGGAYAWGTVFKLSKTGQETVLYSFCPGGEPCTDGAFPTAGVIEDSKGNLYGTAVGGGANNGTVFKLSKTGKETVLHSFEGFPDGGYPYAGVIRDAKGNLYGTTAAGGAYLFGNSVEADP